MTRRRTVLLAAFGGFALAAASLLWADDKRATDQRANELLLEMKLQALIEQRVAAAKRGVEANQAAYDSGTVTLDQIIQSRQDLLEARLAAVETPAQREAAYQEAVGGFQQTEDVIERLYKTGSRGGEANQLAMITVARQTAEIGLLEEQIRNAKGK